MNSKGDGKQLKAKARLAVAAFLAACLLGVVLPYGTALAQEQGEGSWSRGFTGPEATRGIDTQVNTRVSGGALKLAESAPTDLGDAVPGESAVYSMVAVGNDIYLGTGPKASLVQFDSDQKYQEGFHGPTHYGVSNSKGQVLPATAGTPPPGSGVTALAYDGARYVYGGTNPGGHIFSYHTNAPRKSCHDNGAPGSADPVTSMAYSGVLVYFGTGTGHVFTYSGGEDGTFSSDLGQPSGSNAVKAMTVVAGTVYLGTGDGKLFKYEGGAFAELGSATGQINALAADGNVLYAGYEAGNVYSCDVTVPGSFASFCTVPAAVRALAVRSGLYAGASNGHVYLCTGGGASDQGLPANSGGKPVNTLGTAGSVLYGGTGSAEAGSTGRLFRMTDDHEAFGRPTDANNDDITSLAFDTKTLYLARGAHLYSFVGPEPGDFHDYGEVPGVIDDIDAKTGSVFLGLDNGHLYSYNMKVHPGAFYDEGVNQGESPVASVVVRSIGDDMASSVVYVGLADGRLMDGAAMAGAALATLPGASPIKDMCYKDGSGGVPSGLYITGGDGHLYRWDGTSLTPALDAGEDATAANAVTISGDKVFVGHEGGNIFAYDGTSFASWGNVSPVIKSMAPGSQGVLCGTGGGHLYAVPEAGRTFDEGSVPGGVSVRALCHTGTSVWLGTAQGYLYSHDDAHLGDLGEQVKKQIMVWCMAYDPVREVFYAGTYVSAHFLVIDPVANTVTDLGRPIPGERAIINIIVTRDGKVVGSTYGGTEEKHNPNGGHIFTYDPDPTNPARGEFTDRGKAPAPDNNWWISGLVEGPESGNLIYAATSNSAADSEHTHGTFFSIDKDTWTATHIGVPVPDEGTNTLARSGEVIIGASCIPSPKYTSKVYTYTPVTDFTTLGEAPPTDAPVNRLQVDGNRVYGSQDNGNVFWFDLTAPSWEPTSLGKPASEVTQVYPLAAGQDGALLCGSTGGTQEHPRAGSLSSYDPVQSEFRDLDVSPVTEVQHQDRVASIAVGSSEVGGVTFCGTRGEMTPGGADRYAARIFRVEPYKKDTDATALSTVIDPSMVELPASFGGSEAIESVCPAPAQAKQLYVGTSGAGSGHGHIYLYDVMTEQVVPGSDLDSGEQRVLSMCAGPDGKVYVGTGTDGGDGKVKRFTPGGGLTDIYTASGFSGVRAAAAGPDGNIYFGTAESATDPPELLKCDPATGDVTPIPTLLTTGSRIDSLVTSGGKVYGVAGSPPGGSNTVEFFYYDPAGAGHFQNMGTHPEYTHETTAGGLVAAADGKLYFATGLAGKIIRYDPVGNTFTAVHEWSSSDSEVTALTATGTSASNVMLYGCAGSDGRLFKFDPQGAVFTDLGPLTVDNTGVRAAVTDVLGNPYFGTAGSDTAVKLVRYDTNRAFTWDKAMAAVTGVSPVTAYVDLVKVDGTGNLLGPPDDTHVAPDPGSDIPSSAASERAVRLKANLATNVASQSPTVGSWQVTWQTKASVDLFQYPHDNPVGGGAYPGESLGIWGGDFGASQGNGTVTIGGHQATVNDWRANFIQVVVPDAARAGDPVVVTPDPLSGPLPSEPADVTVLATPHVASVSPPSARLGDVVEVRGSGFLASRGSGDGVLFNGLSAAEYTQWSDTVIKAKVPQLASTGSLSVTVNQHVSNAVPFTVIGGGGPTVTITAPSDGASVKGNVTVSATVHRDGGTTPVELWVDGAHAASDPSAPYTFTWNADAVTDGAHTLTVKATDGYGREGSKTVTVYVDHTVPSQSQTWYFAEGCTNYGFETWVLIGNPSSQVVQARVTFMDDKGATFVRSFALAPNSRTTVNAADVAPGANVSVKVDADRQVVCERSMYWGNRIEGHSTIGTTSLSKTWYFAEGSTDYGFETFVLLGNPGGSKVKATVHYLFPDGTSTAREHDIAPHSRVTVDAATDVGARDFSVKIDAGDPGIVAERSMYHRNNGIRRCGTGTIGAKQPSLTWYLSEGSTDWGFETWLLIQRPGAGDARVTASYRKANGETVQRVYTVKGNSRYTVDLSKEVGIADVSTQVTSNVGIVCERSMYWNGRTAGHCTIGSPGPGRTWYLAEGCSDYGFETWVLLDNPSGSTVNATLTFMKEDGTNVPAVVGLKPHSRMSVNAASYVGAASFSTKVSATTPIMVERSVYWNNRCGGTNSIGSR
jgi:hypothetical protein